MKDRVYTDWLVLDWRTFIFLEILACVFFFIVLIALGFKVAFMLFLALALFLVSAFFPEAILLFWSVLVVHEHTMTTVLNLGGGINLSNIFLFIVLCSWLFRVTVVRRDPFLNSRLNKVLLALLALSVFSFIRGSTYFGYELTGELLNAFKRYITTYIVVIISESVYTHKPFIKALFFAAVVTLMYETKVVLDQHSQMDSWHYKDSMRTNGTFVTVGPNELGAFMAQTIPFLFAIVIAHKNRVLRLIGLPVLIVSLLALQYSYSRGAYLAIGAAMLVASFVKSRRLFVVVLAGLVLSYPLWPYSVRERFSSIKETDGSIEGRKEVWRLSRKYIAQSPLIGYGYNASAYLLPRDTHNVYYDVGLEAGLPALLLLWYMLFLIAKASFSLFRLARDNLDELIALGTLGSVVAVIVGNMFGYRLFHFSLNMFFALFAGIAYRLYLERKGALKEEVF